MTNYNDCISDLYDLLRGDPNSIPARVLLGSALKLSSELAVAEEHLTHAILLDPKMPSLYSERGDIKFRMGHKNKLIESIYGLLCLKLILNGV